MALTQKIGKLLIINIIVLVILLITLLFFIQKGGENEVGSIEELAERALLERNIRELYTEAKEKPYFEKHPEELAVTELKFGRFRFTKEDEKGNVASNNENKFEQGEEITFAFDIYDYMNPKVDEDRYVYGIRVWAETRDSDGNIVNQLTGLMADMADYHKEKGLTMSFNMGMSPGQNISPGDYSLELTALDRISRINKTAEAVFKII